MPIFSRILVPADLTDRNRPAVETAVALLEPGGGTLHLLHVIETIPGFEIDDEPDFYGRLEKAAAKHLSQLAKSLQRTKKTNVVVEAEVVYGPRAKTILDEAAKLGCDLIVIQSHRIASGSKSEGYSTLSYQVGVLAPCPVLLVK